MAESQVDRNLLFGILALQYNHINRETLIGAVSAWIGDKSLRLDQHLLAEGKLTPAAAAWLDGLLEQLLQQHQGSVETCLEALSSIQSARHELGQLRDPDLQASLRRVSARCQEGGPGAESLLPSTVGATSEVGARFRILRPHAEGGLGKVWVALDTELNREVALKQIKPQHVDSDSRARFIREGEITGNLEHPNIVPVYGLGQEAEGGPFYAMRFIRGESLRKAICGIPRRRKQAAALGESESPGQG